MKNNRKNRKLMHIRVKNHLRNPVKSIDGNVVFFKFKNDNVLKSINKEYSL